MGIKFHCPNGHKLNVKAFLAGKKAVCPKCGEKVLVPEQSELSTASKIATPAARSPQPMAAATTASAPVSTGDLPFGQPMAAQPMVQPSQPALAPQPTFGMHNAQPMHAALDPIAEVPTAVWYVRPPSGGQFGPAAGDIMRGWLTEGRVTADSLVWRAGWPDWRSAASTFPQLLTGSVPGVAPYGGGMGNAPMMSAPVSVVPGTVSPMVVASAPVVSPMMPSGLPVGQMVGMPSFDESVASDYADPVGRPRKRRQKGADATMVVSGILVVLVIILFIVLGIVLSQQGAVEETPDGPKPKPKPAATSLEKPGKTFEQKEPRAPKENDVQPLEEEEKPAAPDESAEDPVMDEG